MIRRHDMDKSTPRGGIPSVVRTRWFGTVGIGSVVSCSMMTSVASGSGGEGGAVSPFSGDLGNAIWTLIVFGVVVIVLGKFAWGPILSALRRREEFIHDALAQARRNREDAEARLKEYSEKLAAARTEASAIVDEGRRDAEIVRRRVEQQTKEESERILDRARREISIAKETAVKELYSVGGKLATDIAGQILRRELNAAEHSRLIQESIAEFERSSSN